MARAIALRGSDGELAVLATLDLAAVSLTLREAIVHQVRQRHPDVATQNVTVFATHTHTGPSHIFDAAVYNGNMAQESGYDSLVVRHIAGRAAGAIMGALESMRPVVAVWERFPIAGIVENRSPEAHRLNPDAAPGDWTNDGYKRLAVDSMATVLLLKEPNGGLVAGWWTFGLHPMTHATAAEYFDADLPGGVASEIEHAVDDGASRPSHGFVLGFGNGADGDIVPIGVMDFPCDAPDPWWIRRTAHVPEMSGKGERLECIRARAAMSNEIVGRLATVLGPKIRAMAGPTVNQATPIVRTAAKLVPLQGSSRPAELCDAPAQGLSSIGGAEGARTRYHRGHVLGFIPLHAREGDRLRKSDDCHEGKRRPPWLLVGLVARGSKGFPAHALLTAVRIGDRMIVAIPFEPTVVATRRLRDAVQSAVASAGITEVVITGLANNYVGYLTSPEEYAAQHYEGASTLYGPKELQAIQRAAVEVARAALGSGKRADYPAETKVRRGSNRQVRQ
jgi:neutral ceramidase